MIPMQGRIHEPPKTRSKAIGRASQAKIRNIREKPTANAVKQPPPLCCLIFFSFFDTNGLTFKIDYNPRFFAYKNLELTLLLLWRSFFLFLLGR
jgi:hypothetical protein